MPGDNPGQWGDLPSYYKATYGYALRDLRAVGQRKASIFFADHPGGQLFLPGTPDLVLVVMTHMPGRAELDFGAGRFHLGNSRGREFVLFPPGVAANVVVAGQHQTMTLAIPYQDLFEAAGKEAHMPSDGDFGELHKRAQQDPTVIRLVTELWRESGTLTPWTALATQGVILQITSALLRLNGHKERSPAGRLTNSQVQRVRDYAESNLDQKVTLAELAAVCRLSPPYFCSTFRSTIGQSPHQWLRELRIDRSKALLANDRLSIMDIALSVGFQNQGSFATAFRKLTGMSPSSYRALLR